MDDENNPVLLQQRVKKLTKKLKNERKAKEDLESRYQHLYEALEGMMNALSKASGKFSVNAASLTPNQ